MKRLDPRLLRLLGMVVCAALITVLFLEWLLPENGTLLRSLSRDTLSRAAAAVLFLLLLWELCYFGLLRLPVRGGLMWCILPLLVAVNNLPIGVILEGNAFLTASGGEIVWFTLQCLAVAVFEEILFRGCVLFLCLERLSAKRSAPLTAVLLSSFVFALLHLVNLTSGASPGWILRQIGYSFLIGAMCATTVLLTRSILPAILLHFVYNFCGLLIPKLGAAGPLWSTARIVVTAVLGTVTAISLIVAFLRFSRSYAKEEKEAFFSAICNPRSGKTRF